MTRDKAVVVKTFSNEMFARMASLHLEALGIDSEVHKDDCGGAYPQLQLTNGVRLMVDSGDHERAEAILNELEEQPSQETVPPAPPPLTRSLFLSGFVLGLVVAGFIFMILGNAL